MAKREEGAMRGAQRRGKRQIRFDLFLNIGFVIGYDRIFLYHPAPLLSRGGDHWQRLFIRYSYFGTPPVHQEQCSERPRAMLLRVKSNAFGHQKQWIQHAGAMFFKCKSTAFGLSKHCSWPLKALLSESRSHPTVRADTGVCPYALGVLPSKYPTSHPIYFYPFT